MNNINKFNKRRREIRQGKDFLIANLLLLSCSVIITDLLKLAYFQTVFCKLHMILSLIFVLVFYFYMNKINDIKFIRFEKNLINNP